MYQDLQWWVHADAIQELGIRLESDVSGAARNRAKLPDKFNANTGCAFMCNARCRQGVKDRGQHIGFP